jgi:hypothetical protein
LIVDETKTKEDQEDEDLEMNVSTHKEQLSKLAETSV